MSTTPKPLIEVLQRNMPPNDERDGAILGYMLGGPSAPWVAPLCPFRLTVSACRSGPVPAHADLAQSQGLHYSLGPKDRCTHGNPLLLEDDARVVCEIAQGRVGSRTSS